MQRVMILLVILLLKFKIQLTSIPVALEAFQRLIFTLFLFYFLSVDSIYGLTDSKSDDLHGSCSSQAEFVTGAACVRIMIIVPTVYSVQVDHFCHRNDLVYTACTTSNNTFAINDDKPISNTDDAT